MYVCVAAGSHQGPSSYLFAFFWNGRLALNRVLTVLITSFPCVSCAAGLLYLRVSVCILSVSGAAGYLSVAFVLRVLPSGNLCSSLVLIKKWAPCSTKL